MAPVMLWFGSSQGASSSHGNAESGGVRVRTKGGSGKDTQETESSPAKKQIQFYMDSKQQPELIANAAAAADTADAAAAGGHGLTLLGQQQNRNFVDSKELIDNNDREVRTNCCEV